MRSPPGFASWVPVWIWSILLFPSGASAQGHGHAAVPYPELDRMHDEALAVVHSAAPFRDALELAASSHGTVALLRPDDDVRRFACLAVQGNLLHAVGDLRGALWYLEMAAEHAEAVGDPFDAAMTYIDAALVARDLEDPAHAVYLTLRALQLSASPGLEPYERDLILDRFRRSAPVPEDAVGGLRT